MILLSTDGYSNSFSDEEGFLQIGQDYFYMVRNAGLMNVAGQLPDFLRQTSERGSGDDISLGILKRREPQDADFSTRLI